MSRKLLPGHDSKTCKLKFEVREFRTFAIRAHELRTYAGKYPKLNNALFEWLVRKEAELSIDPCTEEQNERQKPTLCVTTATDPYGRVNRLSVSMSESLMSRFEEICLTISTGITELIRNAIDEILSQSIIELALASDDNP